MAQGTETQKTGGNESTETKVVFTPEQQVKVNELIQDAMGRAGREAREAAAAAAAALETLRTELGATRDELTTLKTAKPVNKESSEKVVAEDVKAQFEAIKATHTDELTKIKGLLDAKTKEAETAKSILETTRKRIAIQSAASKANFIDVEVVTKLTEEKIKFDEARGKFIVLNDNGSERMNASYEPMSPDEYFAEFAAKNPYLVRGDVKPGTGSAESQRSGLSNNGKYTVEQIFGPKSVGKLANDLMRSDPAEYKRLKAIAKDAKLIS